MSKYKHVIAGLAMIVLAVLVTDSSQPLNQMALPPQPMSIDEHIAQTAAETASNTANAVAETTGDVLDFIGESIEIEMSKAADLWDEIFGPAW